MEKNIDKYTDEEGDPCFGMPNPPKQSQFARSEKKYEFKKGEFFSHRMGGHLHERLQVLAIWPEDKDKNYSTELDRPFHRVTILRDFTITISINYKP